MIHGPPVKDHLIRLEVQLLDDRVQNFEFVGETPLHIIVPSLHCHLVDASDQRSSVASERKFMEITMHIAEILRPNLIGQTVVIVKGKSITIPDAVSFVPFPKGQVLLPEILLNTGSKDIFEGAIHVYGAEIVGIQDERGRALMGVIPVMFDEDMRTRVGDGVRFPDIGL